MPVGTQTEERFNQSNLMTYLLTAWTQEIGKQRDARNYHTPARISPLMFLKTCHYPFCSQWGSNVIIKDL